MAVGGQPQAERWLHLVIELNKLGELQEQRQDGEPPPLTLIQG